MKGRQEESGSWVAAYLNGVGSFRLRILLGLLIVLIALLLA